MERRELERRFMVENLVVKIEENEGNEENRRAMEEEIKEAVKGVFEKIGFTLNNPSITIKSYGYMPDEQSDKEQRYWTTFHVDQTSALEIWEQQRGIKERIRNFNMEMYGEGDSENKKARWLMLKKHQGTRYEAIIRTLSMAMRILAKTEYTAEDGFHLALSDTKVQIYYDEQLDREISLRSLYIEYKEVFNEAVQTLRGEKREEMYKFAEKMERLSSSSRKRPFPFNPDETVSSAVATTPIQNKLVHLATPISKKMMKMAEMEVSPSLPKDYDLEN